MTDSFKVDGVAIAVFLFLFALVTVLGFVAARWKRGDLGLLDEETREPAPTVGSGVS